MSEKYFGGGIFFVFLFYQEQSLDLKLMLGLFCGDSTVEPDRYIGSANILG